MGFSTTTRESVGKAVVGVLSNLDETKNRAVYVQGAVLTLRELLELAKEALGDEGWIEIDGVTTEEKENVSMERFGKGERDMSVFIGVLLSTVLRGGMVGVLRRRGWIMSYLGWERWVRRS